MSQFPEYLEFTYAKKMKQEIMDLFADAPSVAINLKNVERASMACIQILVAARQKADKEDIALSIEASDSLKKILTQLGLDKILNEERT